MARNVDERTKKLVSQSSAVILGTHVDPKDDIIAERKRASFNSVELANYLHGGSDKLKRLCALCLSSQFKIEGKDSGGIHVCCLGGYLDTMLW